MLAAFAASACSAQLEGDRASSNTGLGRSTEYAPVIDFDAKRDAVADIQAAISEAQRSHKRIILDVGGSWCMFCGQMHELFTSNPDLLKLRNDGFITVAVAYGYGNKDQDRAVEAYGRVLGIPHWFVLDSDGAVLHSQHLVDLRKDGQYDPGKMRDFLTHWSKEDVRADARPAAASTRE